ncbi:MAG: serine/threonine-protein kinase [Gemmatimonadales bacterium]
MTIERLRTTLSDRYRIERELGRGGMGAVYLARDLTLDRPVALKILPPEFAAQGSLRERFLRETRVAASFSHPNIVPVYSVEDHDGVLGFAMGLVEGESVAERVGRSGPLDTKTMVRVLQDIGYALAYAHGRGVVHRDIKPENIMIERATGRALLMDFGISRPIAPSAAGTGLTRVGEVVGTPEFMSPEQATGDQVDGRSDLYSLGLVALFALTGTKAISGTSVPQIITRQLTQVPTAASTLRPDIPPALGAAIDRCVAKEREARFPSAEALVEAIDAAQLAAPEIPLAIRLLAQDITNLNLLFFFLAIFAWFLISSGRPLGEPQVFIPIVVLVAATVTRLIETFFTARRLGAFGYSGDEVLRGLIGVVDELAQHRKRLRSDQATRRRRTATVRRCLIQVLAGAALCGAGLTMRVPVPGGGHVLPPIAATLFITGVALFGVSIVLFVRNPFRMNLTERLFRTIWLGPVGRAFLRLAMRPGTEEEAA